MSRIHAELSANEAGLLQALRKITREEENMEKGLGRVAAESAKAARKQKELERAAKRVYDQTRTPQEQHNARLRELNMLLTKGKINQDTYNRAVQQSTAQMRMAGREGRDAFGAGALSAVTRLTGALGMGMGLAGTLSLVVQGFREIKQAHDEMGRRLQVSRGGLGSLSQLAETPEEMKSLVAAAESLYKKAGAESLDEAANVIFALESAGAMEFAELFQELKASALVEDPAKMATAAKTIIASMGAEEAGTFRDLVSKGFGASKFSPAHVEDIMEGAATAGPAAARLGISDEELLAATAIISEAKGSAEEAGTYLNRMVVSMKQKPEVFKGLTLEEAVHKAAAIREEMGEEKFQTWFGREQGIAAMDVLLKDMPRYGKALAEVETAQREDRVATKLTLHEEIPELKAAKLAAEKKAERDLQEQKMFGTSAAEAQAIIDDLVTDLRTRGRGEFKVWMAEKMFNWRRLWGADEAFIEELRGFADEDTQRRLRPPGRPGLDSAWDIEGFHRGGLPSPGLPMPKPPPPMSAEERRQSDAWARQELLLQGIEKNTRRGGAPVVTNQHNEN